MALYSVYSPDDNAGTANAADKVRFVADGFTYAAFAFGPFWLVWKGLWLEFAAYILSVMLVGAAAGYLGAGPGAVLLIILLMDWFVGLEGAGLVGAKLQRTRFRLADIVAGNQNDEVERRFFARWATRTISDRTISDRTMPDSPAPGPALEGSA